METNIVNMLGYSSYSHVKQEPFLGRASRAKSKVVEEAQQGKDYGKGLDTLLIFYNFEAVPNEFKGTDYLEKRFEVQRYNSKEKSLRVNVFVGFDELTRIPYEEQIAFYYQTTIHSIELVKEKFARSKSSNINVDFERLLRDIKQGYFDNFTWLK